jgi:hypothetical protein
MDHIIVTSFSRGKPWPVTSTIVPGVPTPGFSARVGGGRRGGEVVVVIGNVVVVVVGNVVVVVVGNVVVVVLELALVCSWVVVVRVGV